MLLKFLRLKNIRSYLDSEISFPGGSLLLSGDIGTGKSTILLAIEFALFGLQRGILSGSSLLRAGENNGIVELSFVIDTKEIIVKRTLKRTKDSVVQSTGYIIIDGEIQDCSAVELKTKVLNLLGYPKDVLTKKQLIYRYTVYTPQEEMKQILFENKETRFDILRRVFNVDKYKKTKENAQLYIRELKERQRRFEGIIEDFEDVKKDLQSFKKNLSEIKKEIKELKPDLRDFKKDVEEQKKKLEELEKDQKVLFLLKKEFDSLGIELKHILHKTNTNSFQLEELGKQIIELEKELEDKEIETNVSAKIKIKQEETGILEQQIRAMNSSLGELTEKQTHSLTTIEKIQKLSSCPVCKQDVTMTHKNYIVYKEKKDLEEYDKIMAELDKKMKENEAKLQLIREELEKLRTQERNSELLKLKTKNWDEKKENLKKISHEQEELKKKTELINAKKTELYDKIKEFGNLEERYDDEKEKLDVVLAKEREVALKNATLLKEQENLTENIRRIEIDFKKKQKAKELLVKTKKIHHWLDSYFLVLVDMIEKQIMVNIHHKFNDLFVSFFNDLLEDENTTARLDDTFTPLLVQNGYEVGIENLSGGEKTSCALAYRLALNKVINDILSTIKTRDILILDEPTDGFSTEQLDNLKKVLDHLSTKQTIIVSHEPKVEGFVDSVIEINKSDHVSSFSAR